jgi:alkaline phosphatase
MVVTSSISHATPGSFSAHSVNRNYEEFIAKQQVDNMVDLMFGGGQQFYTSRSDKVKKYFNLRKNNST